MSTYLLDYYDAIMSGGIIVGQEIIQNLENLISDLDNPEYVYDTTIAEKRIKFIEDKCRHTKSPFFRKPFKLMLWQKAFIEVIYSFKWADTLLRRFVNVLLVVGRKNGKSTLCAGISNAEFFCGSGGKDIICSSNDDAQASIIFDEINNMREMIDTKRRITHKNLKGIFHLKKKNTIKKLSDKTKNKEGRNIDFAIIDEIHEMKENTISKSIEQSQSTKDEPLTIEITTEGFVNDGYLDKRLMYARDVLNNRHPDKTFLPWLYTQDSEQEVWQDSSSWEKSNPGLREIKKIAYIEREILKAQRSKADRVFLMCKDFNFHQNSSSAWLDENDIINEETFRLDDFKNAIAIAADDLAETTDLTTASLLLMKKGSSKKYFHCHYFIPESKLENNYDDMDYSDMRERGLLTVVPGNEMDFAYITKWYMDIYEKYRIRIYRCGYDNWHAKYWVNEMTSVFGKNITDRVQMDKTVLSPAMKLVEADLQAKQINYNNNPMTKWCLRNTGVKVDNLMQCMPVKVNDNQNRRIDGAVTLIIAYVIYLRYRNEFLDYVG